MTRAGIGYDLHRLAEGRKLILGGIEVPFHKGPVGHSDGDALAHAICDALARRGGAGRHRHSFSRHRSEMERCLEPAIFGASSRAAG